MSQPETKTVVTYRVVDKEQNVRIMGVSEERARAVAQHLSANPILGVVCTVEEVTYVSTTTREAIAIYTPPEEMEEEE